ncbi:MAG: hypothetical protein JO112_06335, partial [Planctomycetes bacterium]|nr:hypothetical protein [Planctomycetota bacterium]
MNDSARVVRLRYDQRRRWREGEHLRTEVYLDQEPALQADPEAVLELIYNEIVLREENGERPRLEEYLERFPQYGPELRIQFEVHQALEEGPVTFQLKPEPGLTEPRVAPALSGDSVQMPGYEILGELGRGGMGVVYRARHTKLNRVVAVKVILGGDTAGERARERFRR